MVRMFVPSRRCCHEGGFCADEFSSRDLPKKERKRFFKGMKQIEPLTLQMYKRVGNKARFWRKGEKITVPFLFHKILQQKDFSLKKRQN